jgi:hypothetical protein
VGDGVDWRVGFVVVAAVAGVVEGAVEETLFSLRVGGGWYFWA